MEFLSDPIKHETPCGATSVVVKICLRPHSTMVDKFYTSVQGLKSVEIKSVYNDSRELWRRDFGLQTMPIDGPSRFLESDGKRFFIAISTDLHEISPATGDSLWTLNIGRTPISRISLAPSMKEIIIYIDERRFQNEALTTNIMAATKDGEIKWTTPSIIPPYNGVFHNYFFERDELVALSYRQSQLTAFTIDVKTGTVTLRELRNSYFSRRF